MTLSRKCRSSQIKSKDERVTVTEKKKTEWKVDSSIDFLSKRHQFLFAEKFKILEYTMNRHGKTHEVYTYQS